LRKLKPQFFKDMGKDIINRFGERRESIISNSGPTSSAAYLIWKILSRKRIICWKT